MSTRDNFSSSLFGNLQNPSSKTKYAIRWGFAVDDIAGPFGSFSVDGSTEEITAAVPVEVKASTRVALFFTGKSWTAVPV